MLCYVMLSHTTFYPFFRTSINLKNDSTNFISFFTILRVEFKKTLEHVFMVCISNQKPKNKVSRF